MIKKRIHNLGGAVNYVIEKKPDAAQGKSANNLCFLADLESSIHTLRQEASQCTGVFKDEITCLLIARILKAHEKMAWMLRFYIENEPVQGESQKRIFRNE